MTRQPRDPSTMTVVVTGGARGIGRATAERFARLGARVAIGDVDADLAAGTAAELDGASRGRVVGARLDVTDPASWQAFLAEVETLGAVDVLVNNAGIMPLGSVLDEPDAVTRAILDVNVLGVIHGTKAVGPSMVQRGRGHIVNIASGVGRVALANGATYSASKFAVVGFTEAVREELAPHGVDVSMVLPTVVQTELAAGLSSTRGIAPVLPEDVAAVVESAVRHPRPELWVPRWSQGLAKSGLVMPQRVRDAMARAFHADSVLAGADPAAREAYERRVRPQEV